jgi:YaiO family outer membrane protein
MHRLFEITFVLTFLSGLFFPLNLYSQISDPESEYSRIRSVAFSGSYLEASEDARRLVALYPDYGDARILLGRILAWQKNYREAIGVIDTLLKSEPDNKDAVLARREISHWLRDNTPVSTELVTGYSFDRFRQPFSRLWQVYSVGADHKFGWGKGGASLNMGRLKAGDSTTVRATEVQMEIEAWPRLSDKNYAYADYAFSPGKYFPHHRATLEVWQVLPEGWALSAGMNYYYFDRSLYIAVASVEKYIGNYWFSLRELVFFKKEKPTTSTYLTARRYFGNTDFVQVTAGTGTAPDEPFDIQSDILRYKAWSFRLVCNLAAGQRVTLRLGAGFSREEYAENTWRNRYEGGINLVYALKYK